MAVQLSTPNHTQDGTSQLNRQQPALDPLQAPLESRSYGDWLAFARAFARQVYFYDVVDGQVKAVGDWRGFLPDSLDLDEIVAFMENPNLFPTGRVGELNRPHFTLFLAFLKLLRHAQDQLNTLTERHLNYYYRELLRMMPRPARPDRVHALIDLNDTDDYLFLPAGTAFNGGEDGRGEVRRYRSEFNQEINRAQIASLRSLFVDRQLTGVEDIRRQLQGEVTAEELFLRLLRIPLGSPLPGNPLPPFFDGQEMSFELLRQLEKDVQFIATGLYLDFAEYRSLLTLKARFDGTTGDWVEIHDLLTAAARRRTGNNRTTLIEENPRLHEFPRDFDALLTAALGRPLTFEGDALPEVDTIDQLYRQVGRADVQAFVRDTLFFPNIDNFIRLMDLKTRHDAIWQQLMAILSLAGGRRAATGQGSPPAGFPPAPAYQPGAFETNLAAALGDNLFAPIAPIRSLEEYRQRLEAIENYFFMTAEQFAGTVMEIGSRPEATEEEMRPVYALLKQSHGRREIQNLQENLRRQWAQPDRRLASLLTLLSPAAGEVDPLPYVLTLIDEPAAEATLTTIHQRQQGEAAYQPDDAIWEALLAILLPAAEKHIGQPHPFQEHWFNLYAAADATMGKAGPKSGSSWRPFGQPLVNIAEESPAGAEIGWSLTTPLLGMRQGQRTLTLTLDFNRPDIDTTRLRQALPDATYPHSEQARCPLRLRVSTTDGWLEPVSLQTVLNFDDPDRLALIVTAHFEMRQGPLAPQTAASRWPELQLLLRQLWQPHPVRPGIGRHVTAYQPLRELKLQRVHLSVSVAGLVPQFLFSDSGEIDGANPFEPFGSQPTVGSRLTVRDPELLTRRLSTLALTFQWLGRPADLAAHYRHYRPDPLRPADFKVDLLIHDHGQELPLLSGGRLFSQTDPLAAETIQVHTISGSGSSFDLDRQLDFDPAAPPTGWPRALVCELTPIDFQHRRYPGAAAERSLALSRDIAANAVKSDQGAYQVETPYTPQMKNLSLAYTAEIELFPGDRTASNGPESMATIHPFGRQPHDPTGAGDPDFWLPQFRDEGTLYIGLQGVNPPQSLAILFQLADGSADPDLPAAPLRWFYLDGDRWLPLDKGHLLEDGTRNLVNSGIVRLELPAAEPSQLLPAGFYWLRLSAARHTRAAADIIAVHTQAVTLIYDGQPGRSDPNHLADPLPPQSITETLDPVAQIAAVHQPYASFGGRPGEAAASFYTRISERLRHRQRALSTWDIEHLILAEFSEVYKVKCLPASADRPGLVTVVVIPDIKNRLLADPFEPTVPANQLADIRHFLADKIPPFATLRVQNPHYERLKIRVGVRFQPGYRPDAWRDTLNHALNRFLSPWAYDEGAELIIGGKIFASLITHFIEEQPYIDYVSQIKLFRSDDGENYEYVLPQPDGYAAAVQRPSGILVAARSHEIDVLGDDVVEERRLNGINYMKIELDFAVG